MSQVEKKGNGRPDDTGDDGTPDLFGHVKSTKNVPPETVKCSLAKKRRLHVFRRWGPFHNWIFVGAFGSIALMLACLTYFGSAGTDQKLTKIVAGVEDLDGIGKRFASVEHHDSNTYPAAPTRNVATP